MYVTLTMIPGRRSRRLFLVSLLQLSFFASMAAAQSNPQIDSDHDGLTDTFEQTLLETFRPSFMISASDCAGMPARIREGLKDPHVAAIDGTIYGQVFPSTDSKGAVEVHYYTLWNRDCGRMSHPFDVEHVAVLVDTLGQEPVALYWYAGAHEKTVCEISSGAHASAVDATRHGPTVWSSSGKHALYLRKEMCKGGCGADSCEDAAQLSPNGPVINLGELNAPANGALWVASNSWVLSTKMSSDFPAPIVERLAASPADSVVTVRGSSTMRGTIQGSDTVLGGAASGANHTGAALNTANDHTSSSLGKATRATGRSLKRAWNAVFHRGTDPAK